MKATVNLLAVFVSLGLGLSSAAWAGPGGASGSSSGAPPRATPDEGEKRVEAAKSLRLADQAMKDGQIPLAEYYIERAEKLNIAYDPATAKFENTPEKARQKLAQLKSGGKPGAKPAAVEKGGPPADPFAGRNRDSGLDAITNDAKPKAKMFLERGRQALKQSDLVGATGWYQKAVAANAQFGVGEYSPETLAAELRKRGVEPNAAPAAQDTPRELPPSDEESRGGADRLVAELPPGGDFTGGGEFQETTDPRNIQPSDPLKRATSANRPPSGGAPVAGPQGEAFRLVARAREALDRGDIDTARKLAQQANSMNIPDEAYSKELIPWVILLDVDHAASRRRGVAQAGNFEPDAPPAGPGNKPKFPVSQGLYDGGNDRTKNVAASQDTPEPTPAADDPQAGLRLFDAGLKALAAQKRDEAMRFFNQAWEHRDELEPRTLQQLQDQMNALRAGVARPAVAAKAPSALEAVDAQQQLLQQKLAREISAEQAAADKMRAADPRGALERLKKLRDRIRQAQLDPQAQKQLLVLADKSVLETERYLETNKGKIELDERNREVQADVDRDRLRVIEVQNKLAQLVEEFNNLVDQQRYAEAEVLAKQAKELDPESPIVVTLVEKSRFVRRIESQMAIRDKKERGFYSQLESVDEASIGFDDRNPIVFGDAKRWNDISGSRRKMLERQGKHLAPSELEIQQKLLSPVRVEFTETPLAVALDTLGKRVGINIVLDPQGLAAEGITSDTPITMNLGQEISLRSVLNIMLDSLRLSYVIQNEVLKVTSAQAKDSNVYAVVYNVADLVIPIPNFVPGYNVGLPAALRDAYNSLGYGSAAPTSGTSPLTVASNETAAAGNASVLAQMSSPGMNGTFRGKMQQPHSPGPGGLGGGAKADFDTLIDLVTTTIAPTSWDDNGGAGSISGFDTNLSLVVSQTQDVHEQIADLLEQLRRLQDLQVTIEVRFITLQDDFFERIGVQFDFTVKDQNPNVRVNTSGQGVNSIADLSYQPSNIIGLAPPVASVPNPTAFQDIDFRQGGFTSAVPQFGGFDANTAANFGFAILSDIEVFLFVQASQGDTRTNILQAPKVTLFNGQQATISDSSQTPFVTSIIPVVGDFAAAHQPVIVVLSEGTSLSVQAVVSHDRRFVRLTLVPFFSKIGEVKEFTFSGSTTTRTGQGVTDPTNPASFIGRNNVEQTVSGTTVQLPTFAFTTVTTTVSVPDGGTVLLGGVKRLSEGRNERGVPLLTKIPYVNRLFKNVGIGRTTRSLMMMVTPRIIIQEEEEERSVGRPLDN